MSSGDTPMGAEGDAELLETVLEYAVLLVIGLICFWAQALVCEERFVPALNVICVTCNIPDSVAGATLMAGGASSPELFSSFISLFITHSSLGIGTVVGSEIFNHLCICAGSVLASKTGELQLDWKTVARECFFYLLGLVLLLYCLRDAAYADDDPNGPKHVFIDATDAFVLLVGYLAYVLTCVFFENIEAAMCPVKLDVQARKRRDTILKVTSGSDAPSGERTALAVAEASTAAAAAKPVPLRRRTNTPAVLMHLEEQPESNFIADEPIMEVDEEAAGVELGTVSGVHKKRDFAPLPTEESQTRSSARSSTARLDRRTSSIAMIINRTTKMSVGHLHAVADSRESGTFSCYLWQSSQFYTKARLSKHEWTLRYVTVDFIAGCMHSCTDPNDPTLNLYHYRPLEGERKYRYEVLDDHRGVFMLQTAVGEIFFLAPSVEIMLEITSRLASLKLPAHIEPQAGEHLEEVESLMDVPHSCLGKCLHVVLFPLKLLFHVTIPDVRLNDEPSGKLAGCVATSCVLWLAVLSYVMCSSLERLGDMLNIPSAIMGLTVSAVGTSFPNLVASMVVAKQGMGNMAVSNAFGSNTFNIMVGLGLPWAAYTLTSSDTEHKYHGLPATGILGPIAVLIVTVLLFLILLVVTKFRLYAWHGVLFMLLYAVFLVYALAFNS